MSLNRFPAGILVLLSLFALTPLVPHIPRTALAAVIVTALLHMIDYKAAMHILRSRSECGRKTVSLY
jgi:MFS superfamily sulfate permease-like transporter